MEKKEAAVRFASDSKKIEVDMGHYTIIADGGDRTEPSPGTLFLAGVMACTASTARGYCLRNNLPVPTGLTAAVTQDEETRLITKIEMKLSIPPDFPLDRLDALERAAGMCTLKRWWASPPEFSIAVDLNS